MKVVEETLKRWRYKSELVRDLKAQNFNNFFELSCFG